MYLLAISGGPDSMFLLNMYKNENIVVAHVNYGIRSDSSIDEKIVKDFCLKYKIPFHILRLEGKKGKTNFQNYARNVRYTFFKHIYDKYKCKKLLVAHHKDDFLETAIMQEESNREPFYFGIKKNNIIFGMNLCRPLIDKYWKQEIIDLLNRKKIGYAIDYSNFEPIYTRNKIRIELSLLSLVEKKQKIEYFYNKNKELQIKNKDLYSIYDIWVKSDFSLKEFKGFDENVLEKLVFLLLFNKFESIKVSKGKILSIIDFIYGKDSNKVFKISNEKIIIKKNGKLFFK